MANNNAVRFANVPMGIAFISYHLYNMWYLDSTCTFMMVLLYIPVQQYSMEELIAALLAPVLVCCRAVHQYTSIVVLQTMLRTCQHLILRSAWKYYNTAVTNTTMKASTAARKVKKKKKNQQYILREKK